MKNILDGISKRLHIAEEKVNELKDFTTETLQNEPQKDYLKMKRTPVSCGTMSLMEERIEKKIFEKIMSKKFSKLAETSKPTDPIS